MTHITAAAAAAKLVVKLDGKESGGEVEEGGVDEHVGPPPPAVARTCGEVGPEGVQGVRVKGFGEILI